MTTKRLSFPSRARLLGAAWLALAASPLIAVEQMWTAQLKEKVAWHTLTDLGTLLVGTAGAVQSFDPDTGALL